MEGDSRNPRVSLLKKYDIPIDHLSFEYVESCQDKKELERIVRILRSGEEGTYPELIKSAEDKLRGIAPESRVLRVETPALTKESFTNEEWSTLENDLLSWEKEMNVMDKSLEFEKHRFDTIGNKNLPEVRKTCEKKVDKKVKKENEVKKIKIQTNTKNERIKSGDYAAWDKFDVDKELIKLDLEDEREEEKNAKIKRDIEKKKKQTQGFKEEPINIDTESYSTMEQQFLANQAKDRGNECFKAADYNNALKYYNVSLKLFPTANAYNNRAMTYIKKQNYQEALEDCDEVLEREPNNVKALLRRATAYMNLSGKNNDELALKDLLRIITLEPTNRIVQADIQKLKKKLNIDDVGKKYRMMIEEYGGGEMQSYMSKSSSRESELAAIRKLPLTYYGPSTSKFLCEPQSMTHRMLSGPTFNGQVMCKCNSNITRQNPLCHHCGERLSRPKKKSKVITKASATTQSESKILEVKAEDKETKLNKIEKPIYSKTDKEPIKDVKAEDVNFNNQSQAKENSNKGPSEDGNKVKSKSHLNEERNIVNDGVKTGQSDVENQSGLEKSKVERYSPIQTKSNMGRTPDKIEILTDKIKENIVTHKESDPKELTDMMNDLKTGEEKLVKIDSNKSCDVSLPEKEDSSLFRELDISLKQRKNLDNEHCKDLNNQAKGNTNPYLDKSNDSDKSNDNTVNRLLRSNVGNAEKDNVNQCLPSTSGQNELKPESKKSRKKKKSREPRPDGLRFRNSEPAKIVQAQKYLNPTSTEPKSETENGKESMTSDAGTKQKCQFKSFVPNKKCTNTESGVLKSTTASYVSNVQDRDARMSSAKMYTNTNSVERLGKHSEGNKENIMENGGSSFEKKHSTVYAEENGNSQLSASSFEFMKSWEAMKKTDETYEQRAEIMRLVRPEDLKTVIGNNLDSDMLKSLLECLEKHFLESEPNKVASFLKELPNIPRFSIVNLFLNSNERKVIDRLMESTEKKGYALEEEVKKSLKISL